MLRGIARRVHGSGRAIGGRRRSAARIYRRRQSSSPWHLSFASFVVAGVTLHCGGGIRGKNKASVMIKRADMLAHWRAS